MAPKKSTSELLEIAERSLMKTYRPLPVVLARGEGVFLFDTDNRRYLDFSAGVAVASLGYGDKELIQACSEQLSALFHSSNLVFNEPELLLAQELADSSFASRAFFCNSGAEACEAMIKLARKAFAEKDPERNEIICMTKAFHGRTLGTVSCSGQEKYQKGYLPLAPGFIRVPFGDIDAVKRAVTKKTAGIMLEPILGEAGVLVPPQGFLKDVRAICDEAQCLMLLDEVQTGIGRSGRLFAHLHEEVIPDAMTIAKGLGSGLPIGALLTHPKWSDVLDPTSHGSTFGGNPVTSTAARIVLKRVKTPEFLAKVQVNGEYLRARLEQIKASKPDLIKDVRGSGLLCGFEFSEPPLNLREKALEKGLIINLCGDGKTVRIVPPLVIERKEIDLGLDILEDILPA